MRKILLLIIIFISFEVNADSLSLYTKFMEILRCNADAQNATSKIVDCSNKIRKLESKCNAQLYADMSELYCDNFSKQGFKIQSYLYNRAYKADGNEQEYQSIKRQIIAQQESTNKQIDKWVYGVESLLNEMKANEADIAALRADIESSKKSSRAINSMKDINKGLEMIYGKPPKNHTYQFSGGPPVTCTTLNGFTSCN
jgi:hypothetical protein